MLSSALFNSCVRQALVIFQFSQLAVTYFLYHEFWELSDASIVVGLVF